MFGEITTVLMLAGWAVKDTLGSLKKQKEELVLELSYNTFLSPCVYYLSSILGLIRLIARS